VLVLSVALGLPIVSCLHFALVSSQQLTLIALRSMKSGGSKRTTHCRTATCHTKNLNLKGTLFLRPTTKKSPPRLRSSYTGSSIQCSMIILASFHFCSDRFFFSCCSFFLLMTTLI